jgi:hypothetical protein
MTRDEAVRAIARDLKIRARVCGLKQLAIETTATFDDLRAHGAPVEAITDHFACKLLQERLDEERRERGP